uniref:Fucosyltransferase n=1 Tax=Parascaris equorum TaxID=6256 RepID=A0A914S7A5_PAREQ
MIARFHLRSVLLFTNILERLQVLRIACLFICIDQMDSPLVNTSYQYLTNHFGKALKISCRISSNRSRLNEAAAVVFHIWNEDFKIKDLPRRENRHVDQLYVFMTMEAPPNHNRTLIASLPSHFFNLSMTYRRDSDIPFPYGGYWIEPAIAKRLGFVPENLPYDEETILSGKRKPIFWLVSNCFTKSRREVAVKKLQQYIPVDIFGKCATNKINRNKCKRGENCEKDLAKEYYFFIAAENSICKDYVTEKYWDRYSWPTVPIVIRRNIYERLIFVISTYIRFIYFLRLLNCFIFVAYSIGSDAVMICSFAYCKLCERLHGTSSRNSVESVEDWFYGTSECEGHEFVDSWLQEN